MRNQYLIDTLAGIDFLHDLSPDDLDQLAKISQLCEFKVYETIFPEGAAATSVYLIVSGMVSLEICAPSVGCKRILTVGSGDILGWSGLINEARLTATARALELTKVVRIDSAQLMSLCEHNPRFGFELMRRALSALANRLSATRIQLLDIYGSQLPSVPKAGGASDGRE